MEGEGVGGVEQVVRLFVDLPAGPQKSHGESTNIIKVEIGSRHAVYVIANSHPVAFESGERGIAFGVAIRVSFLQVRGGHSGGLAGQIVESALIVVGKVADGVGEFQRVG